MNRRDLIKSAAATASALMITRTASATLNRGIWASLCDGATKLQNDGTLGGCPVSSPYGMVSYWYSYPGSWTSTNQVILGQSTAAATPNISIYHLVTGSTRKPNIPNLVLYAIFGTGSTPTTPGVVQTNSPAAALPAGSGYHLVQISWDLTVPVVKATVNGSPITMGISQLVPPYTAGVQFNSWGGIPLLWNVGGGIFSGGGYFKGNLAEVYAYVTSSPPPDINDPAVQAGFIDSTTGKPPKFEHRTPDGSNAIAELDPQLYLSGPAGIFPYNGKRVANTSAQQSVLSVDGPNFFYVAAGQLQTPTTDPWGNIGV